MHVICLQIFRYLAQNLFDIRQYACIDSVQSNKKSDTFTSTIENAYALTINVSSEANGSSYTNPDVKVYVFKCKDGTYIFN